MTSETAVSAEMSDLVNKAEKWAGREGFNRVPELSVGEICTHRVGSQILTRAALMLMQQMGVAPDDIQKYSEQTKKAQEEKKEEEDEERVSSPISPMPMEEFRNNIRNCVASPCTPRTRATFLAQIRSVPKIDFSSDKLFSEKLASPPKKFIIPKNPTTPISKVILKMPKPTFTSTPITDRVTKRAPRTSNGHPDDLTPFENRASRLRRQKMEERKSLAGNTTLDISMNSSCSSFGRR